MLGYHKDPEATARTLRDGGWLATGDLGYRDADGFYFITGRLKELIIKGGENIAPREIDEALLKHPAVLEAAAVGIPDRDYGQDILACVVLKEDAACTEAELRAHCLAELGRYKTPKTFRFVAELPKGPSGKVQRLRLAEGGGYVPPRVARASGLHENRALFGPRHARCAGSRRTKNVARRESCSSGTSEWRSRRRRSRRARPSAR